MRRNDWDHPSRHALRDAQGVPPDARPSDVTHHQRTKVTKTDAVAFGDGNAGSPWVALVASWSVLLPKMPGCVRTARRAVARGEVMRGGGALAKPGAHGRAVYGLRLSAFGCRLCSPTPAP